MTAWQAMALGVVEGVTEFLPISSTGHLIVAGKLLQIPESAFLSSFYIAIQLGAILSVLVWYGSRLWQGWGAYKKVLMAFAPTAVIGFALYGIIKNLLLNNEWLVVGSLFLGGLAIIGFERWYAQRDRAVVNELESLGYGQAALIGTAQALAVVPGVSRSAATILGGLWLGVSRKTIVEFSFLLAVPTMLAATVLDLFETAIVFTPREWQLLLIGFVVSFVVALLAIKWLLRFVEHHNFAVFGYYRLVAAIIFALLLL